MNDRKEAHIIINSEEDPSRLILKERVYDGNNFQRQQETLIVWTQRQTGLDMALSFEEATDLDKIWKVIDAVQRDITEELRVKEAELTEEASKVIDIDDISVHPSSFRQDIIDAARTRSHDSSEDDQTAEEDSNQQELESLMIRFRTITQEESKAYEAQRFPDVPMTTDTRNRLTILITKVSEEFEKLSKTMSAWFRASRDESRLRAFVRTVRYNIIFVFQYSMLTIFNYSSVYEY